MSLRQPKPAGTRTPKQPKPEGKLPVPKKKKTISHLCQLGFCQPRCRSRSCGCPCHG